MVLGFITTYENLLKGNQGGGMVFNTTFNNIHVISWGPVLAVEETRVPEKTP
jgi:hypothetical protein